MDVYSQNFQMRNDDASEFSVGLNGELLTAVQSCKYSSLHMEEIRKVEAEVKLIVKEGVK